MKRFYPESYDKQADKLIKGALIFGVIIVILGLVGLLFIYNIGL